MKSYVITAAFILASCGVIPNDNEGGSELSASHSKNHNMAAIKNNAENLAPRTGFYAIDGSMANASHKNLIWYLNEKANVKVKHYQQGPQLLGKDVEIIEKKTILRICNDWRAGKIDQVALVGYSRGAAISARVAWRLMDKGCAQVDGVHGRHKILDLIQRSDKPKIRFLGMLDAVNTSTNISPDTTEWIHKRSPSTVCYHYRKHGNQDFISRPFGFASTHFKNCANRVHPDPSHDHGRLAQIALKNGEPTQTRVLGRFWDQFATHKVIGDAAASSDPSAHHFCQVLPDSLKIEGKCPGYNAIKVDQPTTKPKPPEKPKPPAQPTLPSDFDVWSYAACNLDLIKAASIHSKNQEIYSKNLRNHYLSSGHKENRKFKKGCFDGLRYIASYPDLIRAYGANPDKGTLHFAMSGHHEKRSTDLFECQAYASIYQDLRNAYGTNCKLLTEHWIKSGMKEGRLFQTPSDFDVWSYAACNVDLIKAPSIHNKNQEIYTKNLQMHYLQSGHREKRQYRKGCFDGLRYIASYPDLIRAFGANPDKGTLHYAMSGLHEGRTPNLFDCQSYGRIYKDLQDAYGTKCKLLTEHWVKSGMKEGRKFK